METAELRALLEGLADLPYGDERVDQLSHALQTAAAARETGADDDVVLAAALHDIGRAQAVRARFPGLAHEVAGAHAVREMVGERAGWLVGAHVGAKRCLVAEDPAYFATLSPASVQSLRVQGGPFDAAAAAAFRAHPWAALALALRRWDDNAKIPGAPAPSLDEIVARYDAWRAR